MSARVRRAPIAILSTLAVLAAGLVAAAPAQAASSDLFFSEYIEGTGFNKAIEIYNGTGAAVPLAGYVLELYTNGSAVTTSTVALTGSIAAGDVWVGAHSQADPILLAQADYQVNGGTINWNGDDAIVLRKAGAVIDSIGQVGVDPGTEWGTGLTSTSDNTLRRKAAVLDGDTNALDAFDPATQWDGFAVNTMDGFGSHTTTEGDAAPRVVSTNPANNATDVPVNSNVTVTFSEPTFVTAASFDLTCANSGSHPVTVNGGTTTYSLDPTTDFGINELCTLKVIAANVDDVDSNDPPSGMAADFTMSFRTVPPAASCADPQTHLISQVQGSGLTSPPDVLGTNVTVEAVVTAIRPSLSGFFIQEETADEDTSPLTSEGIFVRTGSTTPPPGIEEGDVVQVTGGVREFAGSGGGRNSSQTQISSGVTFLDCGTAETLPAAGVLQLPVADFNDFEHFEGMRVTMPQALVISEYFNYGRFNETVVGIPPNGRARFDSPTAVQEPDIAATTALLATYARSRITVDDGRSTQNPTPPYFPGTVDDPFTLTNTFRGGDTLTGITGVMEDTFGLYRVHPTADATYASVNARPTVAPTVGGDTKIASFNVLNYFLTLTAGTNKCGPARTLDCRGANTEEERLRQRAKIIAAMVEVDADVFGLMEMENTPGVEPAADLAAGLNDATAPGTYSYIDTGVIGTDAIRVGLLYKTAKMTPVGAFKVLNSAVDPRFIDTLNRPTLAQTFQRSGSGEKLTIAVNHLKSKGSACPGDPDTGDGAGNCDVTRTEAAKALRDWLATDPTNSGDPDRLIIGDLNSYDHEDPIDELVAGGYTDLVKKYGGEFAYSFVFDGQVGYLDHGLASPLLVPQVTGATDWHINSDEPTLLDYDMTFKNPPEDALYEPKAYRASDHDPVIVGMELGIRQCQFSDNPVTSTRTLLADCDTSHTILVPNGWTLDGAGHSITAKDPADGHFLGAVVRNAGASASVRNLTVTASSLNDVCDGGDDRLRGILLDGASGSILNNHVLGINQGASGCQEGNAIEVRNAPFDDTGVVDTTVLISGNEVRDYQKGGIISNGSVNVTVLDNTVDGAGPVDYIAQNGVQFGFGATGVAESNTISDNFYTGPDLGCGLLFFESDGVKQKKNTFSGNERDVCNFGRGGGSSPTKR